MQTQRQTGEHLHQAVSNSCYYRLHPPSPFIIVTQPENRYSFYRPTDGEKLSRPQHHSSQSVCVTF